ncbi:pirin-like C-terminal cupin domain-containing protein [Nigerium massiliense]|uniref:pirin-like C-terminal cupin domain-containing protein n=1 Tax=Nigerium massiliense TaxID=1522317 RepID=UPI001C473B69|nr:pirin-like C-terminal cupin domain-containing protein [Nigerium massiliense]
MLVDAGEITWHDTVVKRGQFGFVEQGPDRLSLTAGPDGAHLLLLGGEPYEGSVPMWWNFIEREQQEIVDDQREWNEGSERFGEVEGYPGVSGRIPAPPLPAGPLRPRDRHHKIGDAASGR